MKPHYGDGVRFVALAAITEPSIMAATIATAVGCSDSSTKPPQTRLIEFLRRKTMLLLLDNLEQLLSPPQSGEGSGVGLIAELVAECPGVCVLVTSRERLHLRAEQRFKVPPLDLAPAVELFVQRAQAVDADFVLTSHNRPMIEAICQRLDCLPLALELCAAQIELFSPAQLLAQLQARPLDLLVDGAHDLPPQQRTLRRAIGRSYALLEEEEQTLLRSLGVFLGGFDLATVAAVVEEDAATRSWRVQDKTMPPALVATLRSLVSKSLVHTETLPSGEARFRLLETLREFALEQVQAHGEEAELRQRHYLAYLHLFRTGDSYLRGAEATAWFARLEPEQDNLRAALQWTLDAQRYADTAWLLVAVAGFWFHNGHWYETGQWLAQLLPHRQALDNDLRLAFMIHLYSAGRSYAAFQPLAQWNAEMTQLLDASTNLALQATAWHYLALTYYATDYPRAMADLARAIAYARAAGAAPVVDRRYGALADYNQRLSDALWAYANALVNQGELASALPLLLESRNIYRQRENGYEIAACLGTLGLLALLQGDLAHAREQLHEAVMIATDFNYRWMMGFWQPVLGFVTLSMGDTTGARTLLTESLRLCTELKIPMLLARNLTFLAELALWEGQHDQAAQWLAQSLTQEADPGLVTIYEVIRLWVAARLATAQQQNQRAATLFGLADQMHSQVHDAIAGPIRALADEALVTVRAALDPAVFADAFAAGQQMALAEAFATIFLPEGNKG